MYLWEHRIAPVVTYLPPEEQDKVRMEVGVRACAHACAWPRTRVRANACLSFHPSPPCPTHHSLPHTHTLQHAHVRVRTHTPPPPLTRVQVREALSLAYDAHSGQSRKSGEPFITHPVEVTRILAELKMDYESLVAGAGGVGWGGRAMGALFLLCRAGALGLCSHVHFRVHSCSPACPLPRVPPTPARRSPP